MSDVTMLGLTRVEQMAEEDENAEAAFSPHNFFGPNGFGVPRVVPHEPSTVAARGATWEGCSDFIWRSMERNRKLTKAGG